MPYQVSFLFMDDSLDSIDVSKLQNRVLSFTFKVWDRPYQKDASTSINVTGICIKADMDGFG